MRSYWAEHVYLHDEAHPKCQRSFNNESTPNNPCMVYLPTFTIIPTVGRYTIMDGMGTVGWNDQANLKV